MALPEGTRDGMKEREERLIVTGNFLISWQGCKKHFWIDSALIDV